MKLHKKGNAFGSLGAFAMSIAVLVIILMVTFLVMSQGKKQIGDIEGIDETSTAACSNSASCNGTVALQDAVGDIPGWVPIVIIVSIGAILLGLVKTFSRSS